MYNNRKFNRCSPTTGSERCLRILEPELAGAFETYKLTKALEGTMPAETSVFVPDHYAAKEFFENQQEYAHLSELMNRMKTVASERFQAHLHIVNSTVSRWSKGLSDAEEAAHPMAEPVADKTRNPLAEITMVLFFDGSRSVKFAEGN